MLKSNRKTIRFAGALIIIGIISGIFSIVPSVEGAEYLNEVYPNRKKVLIGSIFQFLLVPIYIGFSLLLYKVIKKNNESLAIGFVGFRFVAGVFQLIGVILLPIFIYLSKVYLSADSSSILHLENLGEILKITRDLTNHLGVILATGLGNLLLYGIFYLENYIPKWLTIWGIVGNILIMLASFLILFQSIEVISTAYGMMTIPLVIQEIVLAIWLITKGLNISDRASNMERTS